jgi:uncharacterized protein (DUF1330 family)
METNGMAGYLIATVDITDPASFGEYVKGIEGLSASFGGEVMVRGQASEVLEGDMPTGLRVIVSRYPDAAAAKAYLSSPQYQAAKQHRLGAAEVNMLLLED